MTSACSDVKPTANQDPHAGPAMNYHVINQQLATSGHFVAGGLDQLAKGGLQVVIDLRDSPPSDQEQTLAQLGVVWVGVPVDWNHPKVEDFEKFKIAMSNHSTDNLLVQCGANYRASAMTYLYQVLVDNVPEQRALQDLHAVWEPNSVWSDYIAAVKARERAQD